MKQTEAVNLLIKQLIKHREMSSLNKEAEKSFLKNQITKNVTNNMKIFWKLCKPSH